MRRRAFISLLGGAAVWPVAARAQPAKALRVAAVSVLPAANPVVTGFKTRMAELGYAQGRNFDFEYLIAPDVAGIESAYRDIMSRKVDILFCPGNEFSLESALAVTRSLPIVFIAIDYDPVALGYVGGIAHPGGNATGIFFRQIELTEKRLQLVKEMLPGLTAVTVFWDRISADQWSAAQRAASAVGLGIFGVELRARPYDFERAFARVPPQYRGGLMVLASPIFTMPARRTLPDFALRHRIPTMFFAREYVAAGGLASYGASLAEMGRRAADYVDKIAKGARPANLPIEQPTRFELSLNLKTARALGMTIPPSILARAEEVIE